MQGTGSSSNDSKTQAKSFVDQPFSDVCESRSPSVATGSSSLPNKFFDNGKTSVKERLKRCEQLKKRVRKIQATQLSGCKTRHKVAGKSAALVSGKRDTVVQQKCQLLEKGTTRVKSDKARSEKAETKQSFNPTSLNNPILILDGVRPDIEMSITPVSVPQNSACSAFCAPQSAYRRPGGEIIAPSSATSSESTSKSVMDIDTATIDPEQGSGYSLKESQSLLSQNKYKFASSRLQNPSDIDSPNDDSDDDPDYTMSSSASSSSEECMSDEMGHSTFEPVFASKDKQKPSKPVIVKNKISNTASTTGSVSMSTQPAKTAPDSTTGLLTQTRHLRDISQSTDNSNEAETLEQVQSTPTHCMVTSDPPGACKKSYCYFCGVAQSQIQRHWFAKHGSERQVVEIDKCKENKDKQTRNQLIARLRNLGNHHHNVQVLRKGQGEIIVTHRKSTEEDVGQYVPCGQCYSYVKKNQLWRHKCLFGKERKGRVAQNSQLLLPAPNGMTSNVYELISSMKDDDVRFIAKSDSLIIEYATKLVHNYGMHKKHYVRDKMREMARFVMQLRKIPDLESFKLTDIIAPENFKHCLTATRELTGFDASSGTFKTPSLALKIGHALKKVAKILKRQKIESRDYDKIVDIDYFHDLCADNWGDEISSQALDTLKHQKRNKVNLLPVTSDVQKLLSYLRSMSEKCKSQLHHAMATGYKQDVPALYRELAEATLADIIIFNRRRQGEASKMTIDDYGSKTKCNLSTDVIQALEPMEQQLCKLFTRVELRGKCNNVVPVLLNGQIEDSIDLMMKCREDAEVRGSNKYLFALPSSENYIRGSDALRNASRVCGAEHPDTLTSTSLRKHVATVTQVLNLKDNELDMLAKFMGHDIRVHREFYRLPSDVLQTSQLAKIFMLMESGDLAAHKGKSLAELMVMVTDDSSEISECSCHVSKLGLMGIYGRSSIMPYGQT